MPDASFLFGQFVSGMTTAMLLFLIASGLTLIFGVLGVLNFAHGSFYMLGAYLSWQIVQWLGPRIGSFWIAVVAAALTVAVIGAVIERLLLRHLYRREELYQLLFTYALVLVIADLVRFTWGTQQLSLPRPAGLDGAVTAFGAVIPTYSLFILALGPIVAIGLSLGLNRTGIGRTMRAAASDREMLGALGANVSGLYTGMFALGSFFAGLAGALVSPIRSLVPGMDVEIIVEAFIIVVIGGLGSLWGTLVGALIFGQVLAFGILVFPRFSVFAAFVLMAVVLVVRPWGLFGKPLQR
jgi:branched-subunit amino acid ABC-type transport system permease component